MFCDIIKLNPLKEVTMKNQDNLSLGSLKLETIPSNELENFKQSMKAHTIPKIKEDVKRNRHNVTIARNKMAYK